MNNRGVLDADMQTVGGWAADAWYWWRDEMVEMVPHRWRDRAAARRQLADYRPQTSDIVLQDDGGSPAVRGNVPVAIILPHGLCLTRVLERPAMSPRDLQTMLALEADRIFPLGAGEAVLAARVIARDEVHRRVGIEVAAIPNTVAQSLSEALARLSRPCLAVFTEPPQPGQSAPIDLLPALRRTGFVADTATAARGLWIGVAVLFALNIGLLVWQDSAATDTLTDIVHQQQPAVDTARRIAARVDQIDRFVGTVRAKRGDAAPRATMGQIAMALPPGVWLQRYGWQGDSIRIAGYRPPLADVSAALRRAGFSVARYSETAATGQSRLGQAFEITLRLRKPS